MIRGLVKVWTSCPVVGKLFPRLQEKGKETAGKYTAANGAPERGFRQACASQGNLTVARVRFAPRERSQRIACVASDVAINNSAPAKRACNAYS
jgi:hypothetical protein